MKIYSGSNLRGRYIMKVHKAIPKRDRSKDSQYRQLIGKVLAQKDKCVELEASDYEQFQGKRQSVIHGLRHAKGPEAQRIFCTTRKGRIIVVNLALCSRADVEELGGTAVPKWQALQGKGKDNKK